MEVKIGIGDGSRELVFTSAQTQSEIEDTVTEALNSLTLLGLTDENGRRYLVYTNKIAHVEIGQASTPPEPTPPRRVGYPSAGEKETR